MRDQVRRGGQQHYETSTAEDSVIKPNGSILLQDKRKWERFSQLKQAQSDYHQLRGGYRLIQPSVQTALHASPK